MRGIVQAALISEKQISDKRCLSSSSVTVPYCGFTCPCAPRVILVLHRGADFQLRHEIRPRRVGSVNWVGSREEAGRRYEPESFSCSVGFCTVRASTAIVARQSAWGKEPVLSYYPPFPLRFGPVVFVVSCLPVKCTADECPVAGQPPIYYSTWPSFTSPRGNEKGLELGGARFMEPVNVFESFPFGALWQGLGPAGVEYFKVV